jgi:hypothetical protein
MKGPAGSSRAFFYAPLPISPLFSRQVGVEHHWSTGSGELGMRARIGKIAMLFLVTAMAACAPKPAPVPPPKPPPVVIVPPKPVIPTKPWPPGGAASSTKLPSYGADGVRVTPNRGLTRDESVWHFRSAINVAALNCQGPVWGVIAQQYNEMLKVHKARLTISNTAVDNEYRKRYPGQNALRVRDTKMTDLYNYFALPPVKQEFCDTALRKSQEAIAVPLTAFPEYAMGALNDVDGIFLRFYDAYAKYERDIADWNLKYGPPPAPAVAPTPGTTATTPVSGTPSPTTPAPKPPAPKPSTPKPVGG